jgi:hypothetical protein
VLAFAPAGMVLDTLCPMYADGKGFGGGHGVPTRDAGVENSERRRTLVRRCLSGLFRQSERLCPVVSGLPPKDATSGLANQGSS